MTLYFSCRWPIRRVLKFLYSRGFVQGCFNPKQKAFDQGLHIVWNNEQKLVWAFGERTP